MSDLVKRPLSIARTLGSNQSNLEAAGCSSPMREAGGVTARGLAAVCALASAGSQWHIRVVANDDEIRVELLARGERRPKTDKHSLRRSRRCIAGAVATYQTPLAPACRPMDEVATARVSPHESGRSSDHHADLGTQEWRSRSTKY
jgi:hypothetical protein